ncbi:hypothetical protein [Streptomyces sp. XD-27]|uniref:hypothetical protein n=1 Tax=Streptomyces sp. XD-27 TaxID=3062779 RepID=UPI0026F41B62|nr:hypothetical protein [Streptomyces sp. XD-27]WKX70642.1 hypothetical protein Q3Y56_12610 [Streptomyces sp. XD-27]
MTEDSNEAALRQLIIRRRPALNSQQVDVSAGENPESAGNDPIMWVDFSRDLRWGRISLWRGGEVELELADLETGEIKPLHFTLVNPDRIIPIIDRLTAWVGAR